jgi:hypothetical protein
MKLKMKLEWIVELDEGFNLISVEQIARNFETDDILLDMLAEGLPISDVKCTVIEVEHD